MHASAVARRGDLVLAACLFVLLASLSWLRWASFLGDLSREWTVPMRLAAGERLWKDVGYYYGPLAPHAVAGAFRVFGSSVATYVGFGLLAAAGTLAALLLAGRRFLTPLASAGAAAVAVGVLAFAPENGAFVAPYAMAALLSIGLAWGAFLLAASGRAGLAGVAGALALLAKPEAAPALLGAALAAGSWRAGFRLLATAGLLAASVYGVAMAGIPVADLVSYGPLRHFSMPAEFRELYVRVSGLHPALLGRGVGGLLAGGALLAGWALLLTGLVARRTRLSVVGGTFLAAGLLADFVVLREPIVTTGVRGLPLLLAAAGSVAFVELRRGDASARLPLAAALVGLAFAWRTAFWTVPVFPYAPLAAVSSLPAVAWLLGIRIPRAVDSIRRTRAAFLAVVPLLLSPVLFLPRLVLFYRTPRTEVAGPAGRWLPPGEEGELFEKLLAHLTRVGVKDRDLVVLPEAGALGFLLEVRSPLHFEQVLPGHVDARVDRDLAGDLDRARPTRVVVVSRPTPEYGPVAFGREYAIEIAARLARDYVSEARYSAGEMTAVVLRRR
ncbi:MAG: hypothetical protein IPL90_13435 [Holophagales bacterium]|nr:hypothetical protein [Holophagales bacterium]